MNGPKVSQLDVVQAQQIVTFTGNAARTNRPAEYIAALLDVIRDPEEMDARTDSPLVIGLLSHAERRGLLGR